MLGRSRGKDVFILNIRYLWRRVAEDIDGNSSWRVETIPAESCVVGEVGGSSWPVAEDAPKYLKVPLKLT